MILYNIVVVVFVVVFVVVVVLLHYRPIRLYRSTGRGLLYLASDTRQIQGITEIGFHQDVELLKNFVFRFSYICVYNKIIIKIVYFQNHQIAYCQLST